MRVSEEYRVIGRHKDDDRPAHFDYQGVRFGQVKKLTPRQITELQNKRKQGALIKTLMQDYRIAKATVYRYLKQSNVSP